MVSLTSRPLFNPEKDPVPVVQEAGWAPGLVWTGAENTGIRSPDRPARSQSLYRLRHPAHRVEYRYRYSNHWAFEGNILCLCFIREVCVKLLWN